MRKTLLAIAVLGVVLSGASAAQAVSIATYTFEPEPADLWDLSHNEAYEWGIDFSPYAQYEIVEANLTFHNIYNWAAEDNWLHINLLDDPQLGTTVYNDGYNANDNYFDGQGHLLATWSDIPGGGPGSDLSLTFSTQGWLNWLREDAADGTFGFGIDPDCHFYNDGITLTVASAVPEPATMLLFGFGIVGAGFARRRKK